MKENTHPKFEKTTIKMCMRVETETEIYKKITSA